MEDASGGGFGGRDRGEGRDAPDFNPSDFSDIADLVDLEREREQERTGRFGARSIAAPPGFDYGRSIFGLVRGLVGAFPGAFGLGPIPGAALGLVGTIMAKDKEKAFGQGALSMVPGWNMAEMIGRGAQKAAKGLGATGGPQATFGDQPASPGLGGGTRDVDPLGDTTKFDRGELMREARDYAVRNRVYGGA